MSLVQILVGITVAVFGLIVLVAAAIAVARTSFARAQIEALRGDRDDLITRVQMLEAENVRVSDALKTEREARKVLERVVTGKEQLEHLQSTMDLYIKSTVEWREAQRDLLQKILDALPESQSRS
jgi:hypothetical protein